MVRENRLVLLILIILFSFSPISCSNNSTINLSHSSISNASDRYLPPSDNISDTAKADLAEQYDQIDWIANVVSIAVGLLTIAGILAGCYLWLRPNARNSARRKILGLLKTIGLSDNDSDDSPDTPDQKSEIQKSIFKLPYPPNPNFTGRQSFLRALAQQLNDAALSPKIFALVGNGGMGKTQIALQHARIPENNFKYVWWLRSEEPAVLLDDYIKIAEDLNLPGWNLRDTDQTVKSVTQWLESENGSQWLLVFDNAQKQDDLMRYIPASGQGQIIITSRLSVWDGIAETLKVDVFQRDDKQDESIEFLIKRTAKNDRNAAAILARELGDMPLALEQAGAYIKETGITLQDYLDRFRKDRKKLLGRGNPFHYHNTVATTWEISFQAVQKELPVSGELLNLCGFLAPDAIPRWLLKEGAKHLPEPLATSVQNASELDDLIAVLKKYSLINAADNLISVHRLVQVVVRDRLNPEEQKKWAESALKLVNDAFSFDQLEQETWEKCSRLSSHAFHASEHAESLEVSLRETASLLDGLGRYLNNRMELASARSAIERALEIDEKIIGPEHISVARDVNDLGSVLQNLDDLMGAMACFERALAIDEKAFGPYHASVARDINNLGSVLRAQGDLAGAMACFKQALDIDEMVFGTDHTTVARDINNLGLVLWDQGNLAGAKARFERALAIDEKALGPNHASVARDINNLGSVLRAQGDLTGAKARFERALAIDEIAFGTDHTTVARDINNLGLVLWDQGNLAGAKARFERALVIDEKVFGPNHTSVAIRVNDLGGVLFDLGDRDGAKACATRAFEIFEMRLGADHPHTKSARHNLDVFWRQPFMGPKVIK